jgi:predicted anti-sigma-YlaC factor YlaD
MLPFYLESEVSPESRMLIDEHLNECERCASFMAGAQSVQTHLRRENLVRGKVIDHDRRAQQIISTGQRQLIMLVLAVVGAIALLMVVGGLVFVSTRTSVSVAPAVMRAEAAPMPMPPSAPMVPPPGN